MTLEPVVAVFTPKDVSAAAAVDAFVPPLAMGRTPVMFDAAEDATLTKSTPFQAATHFSPATKVIPVVGPTPTSLMLCVLEVLLITM
jgi:hypothetical protein